jgi:hypothetical protein
MIATRVLKCADEYYKAGIKAGNLDLLFRASSIYTELLPFILPKLQSMSIDADIQGNIDINTMRTYLEAISISKQDFIEATDTIETEIPALPPGTQ